HFKPGMMLQQLHKALPDNTGSAQDSNRDLLSHKGFLGFYNTGRSRSHRGRRNFYLTSVNVQLKSRGDSRPRLSSRAQLDRVFRQTTSGATLRRAAESGCPHVDLGSGSDLGAKGIFIQWSEALFLGIEAPATPHDAQAGHDGDGKVNA